ncbi:MAG: hypothetical protein U0174_03200 [Polyangiaceae bacterium]
MHRVRPLLSLPVAIGLLAVACSSSDPTTPPPTSTQDASTVDAKPDASAPSYEEVVAGARWTKLEAGPKVPQGKQDDIFFTSAKRGFAVSGGNSSVYRTEDGGATWKVVFKKATAYFRAVYFLDEMHGFVGNLGPDLSPSITDTTVLYETKDGGENWAPVTNITGSTPKGICNLAPIDATHLAAIGRTNGPAHLITSSDAGANWVSVDLKDHLSMAIDAHFSSPSEGVVVGQGVSPTKCTIIRTEDGGKTFSNVFTATSNNSLCWKVNFPSPMVGYVAIQQTSSGPPAFAKTTDGGKTWKEMPLPQQGSATKGYAAIAIGFITDKIGWVAPESKSVPAYRTLDGGETWEVDDSITPPINRFRFIDKQTAYAIGGAVWKLEIPWATP